MVTEPTYEELLQRLRESEAQKRAILDGLSENVSFVNEGMETLWVNTYAAAAIGKGVQEIIGRKCFESIWGRDRPCDRCPALKVFETRKSEQRVDRAVKGKVLERTCEPVFNEAGDVIGVVKIIRNITAQTLAEDALRESERRYRTLLEANPDPVVVHDVKGRVTYLNPAFTAAFGWSLEECVGTRLEHCIPNKSRPEAQKMMELAMAGECFTDIETHSLTKDGRTIPVSISSSVYRNHEGLVVGHVINLRDISHQKELEAQLLQAQKMEAMGTLAGGIAHDFNNLLMGIQGRTSLMLLKTARNDERYEHLKGIEDYIKSATDLTKQLLGFARGGKYEVKPTDINMIIERCLDMFGRTRKQIKIHKLLASDIWTVEVDRAQFEQVLLNLLVNAWQAMAGIGEIFLETENTLLDETFVRAYDVKPGRFVRISVTDTGIGMSPEIQAKVFDPFFTTREMGRGTGLGLASAYGIIRNHHGIINVKSKKGEGATFNIYLPAFNTKPMNDEDQDRLKIENGTETVLLVDDEEMIIDVGQEILKTLGYRVFIAHNGADAVALYRQSGHSIDIVILDMIMPEMSGGEVYDRLKEIDPEVKVLLSSGYSLNGEAKQIINRGCNGFIQKPFNIEELSHRLRAILERA